MVRSLPEFKAPPTQQAILATLLVMAGHCCKRLWPAEQISHHFSHNSMAESAAIQTRPDTKMYYLFNKVNVQGESRQPWHLEGPHEAPTLFISQSCYQEKSLRLSTLYLLLVLKRVCNGCSHYTKPPPIYATLVYSQQGALEVYFHSCWPSDKSRTEIKKLQACWHICHIKHFTDS